VRMIFSFTLCIVFLRCWFSIRSSPTWIIEKTQQPNNMCLVPKS
jgi:hypothetical protein